MCGRDEVEENVVCDGRCVKGECCLLELQEKCQRETGGSETFRQEENKE